jgi:hypothetical protein
MGANIIGLKDWDTSGNLSATDPGVMGNLKSALTGIASFLSTQQKTQQDQQYRAAIKKEMGIDVPQGVDAGKLYEELITKKAEAQLDPEKQMFNRMFSGMGGGGAPPVAPDNNAMPGTVPAIPPAPQINQSQLLRGMMSKKFGVPYESMATPEEKQATIKNKVDEARALEEGKPLSADAAGKLAMVTQAESDLNEAEGLLFPGGKFSPNMAFQTNFPGGGMPATEGRQAYSKVLNAVNAKLRIETGAQANPSEVQNILQRFMPTMRDTDVTAQDKFRRLKEFMATTKSIIDPRGRFDKTQGAGNEMPTPGAANKVGKYTLVQ